MRGLLAAVAFLSTITLAWAQTPSPPPTPASSVSASPLARAHESVSTQSDSAQAAFDDGLTLLYAFNPQEARRSFERAAADDDKLAMAYWGVAMSYGININTSYDPAMQRQGHDAILKAVAREGQASAVERAMIDAANLRFSYAGKNDADASAKAYSNAMNAAAALHPDDDTLLTLAAEAAMDAHPWGYWHDDGSPETGTLDIVQQLTTVLVRNPAHIGANHLLIHALEASPHPEGALESAQRLAADTFEPGAEHLAHMPAHTFMRTGDYAAAGLANTRALDDFHTYLAGQHAAGHESYQSHDCLFGVDAYMMAGEHKLAQETAARCGSAAGRYAGDVAVRFRRWSDLAADVAESPFLRAMSDAASGRFTEALSGAQQLDATKADTSLIAADVVRAKVADERGETDAELAALESAAQKQDKLGYSEPPQWFFPVRESLGAAYFRAGRYANAERTFRADLAKNPLNPRSLFGLAKTLAREGHVAEAASMQEAFTKAWANSDGSLDMKDL